MAAVRENLDHDYKIFLGGDEFCVPANEWTTLQGLTGEITHRKYAATGGEGLGGWLCPRRMVKEDKRGEEGTKGRYRTAGRCVVVAKN